MAHINLPSPDPKSGPRRVYAPSAGRRRCSPPQQHCGGGVPLSHYVVGAPIPGADASARPDSRCAAWRGGGRVGGCPQSSAARSVERRFHHRPITRPATKPATETGLNRIDRHTSTGDTEFYTEQAQKPMCGSALVLARRGSVAGETVKADVSPLLFLSTKSNPGAGGPRAGKGCSGASVGLTPRMYPARTTHLSTLSIPPFPLQHEKGINPRPHPNTQRKVF